MKKFLFFLTVFCFFYFFSTAQTTISDLRVVSLDQVMKTNGYLTIKGGDSTITTYKVRSNGTTARIKIKDRKKLSEGDAIKVEDVALLSTTNPTVVGEKKEEQPAVANIIVNGVQYAPYTGSEAPASAPGVAKPGYLLRNGKWYKRV